MRIQLWVLTVGLGMFAALGSAGAEPAASDSEPLEYGIGLRVRALRVPAGLIELFMERAPGATTGYGAGIELARRRGNLELQLGAEFDYIQPAEGVYIESGGNVAPPPAGRGDEADFLLSPEHNGKRRLGWFTIEFTFLNHASITKRIAIRYGAGLGIGILRGELGRYDIVCTDATNASPAPGCVPPDAPFNGSGTYSDDGGRITPGTIAKYDLPRVLPVINAILGIQIRPFKKMTINVEGGIRTVPFVGASTAFFF